MQQPLARRTNNWVSLLHFVFNESLNLRRKRLDITVQWLGQDESVLEVDQCIQRLNDEIGCDLGGSKVTDEWSFT